MSCFAELKYFLLTKYLLADDSESSFSICKQIFIEAECSWKDWLSQFYSILIKKISMWFSWRSCDNTCIFWDFRYLKRNGNLSVKSKFNCRRLTRELPKSTRHRMVEKSERFFLMRLLQWNVKSSRPGIQ